MRSLQLQSFSWNSSPPDLLIQTWYRKRRLTARKCSRKQKRCRVTSLAERIRRYLFAGQNLFEPRVKPGADRQRDLEELGIRHNLQHSAGGIEHDAATAATRDML